MEHAVVAGETPPKIPRPSPAPLADSPVIQGLEAAALRDPRAVERFWEDRGSHSPLVEPSPRGDGERIVTFLWRDADAEDVLLFVNRLTDERTLDDSLMRRLPGTDVWHLSYRMASDWRASYCFLPRRPGERPAWRDDADQIAVRAALDRGLPDPRNPHRSRNRAGIVQSVAALPDAPAQQWLAPRIPAAPRGRLDQLHGPDDRRIWVHRPPTDDPYARLPVVVVLDGEVWTSSQDLATTVDNLQADRLIPPARYVFVDSGGRERRWRELGGAGGASYIADRLVPWAQDVLHASADPRDVIVVGQSLGALTALQCGIHHPHRVGAVLSQSASLWHDDLAAAVAAAELSGSRIHLEVGLQEWVLHEPNRALARRLKDVGADVRLVEYNGGHDYACWRGGVAEGLISLLA